jgi:hypothetical protein
MNKQELQLLLKALRSEIDNARLLDPAQQQRLSVMLTEIEGQLLAADPAASAAPEGLIDNLKLAVEQFEVEHPRFAAMLNQLVNALSAMGI